MYKVYCDGFTLHDPSLNDTAFQLLTPVVTQEVNKADSFTFMIPKANANANALHRLKSTIEVYDDNKLIFRGRILNDTRDWNDSRNVVCEGDIAMLNDSVQRPYTFTGTLEAYLRQLVSRHNAMVPAEKQFAVGTVDVSGTVTVEQTNYVTTWHELEDKILNRFSGYLFVTWTGSANRIDFLADSPYHCGQKISFGENLLDITRESKGEDIITVLIPLGAKNETTGEHLTIKSVNGGLDYITSSRAAVYGLIFGTETWDSITSPAELLVKGQERLEELSQGMTTITLTAADLHLLDASISSFDFLSYITVEDHAHDISGSMLVTKKTTHLSDPSQGTLTIGQESSGISKYYAETNNQLQVIRDTYVTQEQVSAVETTLQGEIQAQADKIAMVVTESAGSYVINSASIVAAINESGSSVQISADHIALTGEVVVSLINGGSTTINGNKITTGTLNASAIGAGTIDASVINVINVTANRILVQDNNSNVLMDANSSGHTVKIAGFEAKKNELSVTERGTHVAPEPPGKPWEQTFNVTNTGLQLTYDYWRYSETTQTEYNAFYSAWLRYHRLRIRGDFRNDPDDPSRTEGIFDAWGVNLSKYTNTDPETQTFGTTISPTRTIIKDYTSGNYTRQEAGVLRHYAGDGSYQTAIGTSSFRVTNQAGARCLIGYNNITTYNANDQEIADINGDTIRVYDRANNIYGRLQPSNFALFSSGTKIIELNNSGLMFNDGTATPRFKVLQRSMDAAGTTTMNLASGIYVAITSHNNNSSGNQSGLAILQVRSGGTSSVLNVATANNSTLSISGGTLTWTTTNTYRTLTLLYVTA